MGLILESPDPGDASGGPSWHARAHLNFGLKAAKTVLTKIESFGPLYLRRLFYPEGPGPSGVTPAQACLLHPPGGLVSGDFLEVGVNVGDGAQILMTTPSATKLYRARDHLSLQRQEVEATLNGASVLEWLPQETIVFSGARGVFETVFRLSEDSRLIAWDVLALGRPEAGEKFSSGGFSQGLSVFREGVPVILERLRLGDFAGPGSRLMDGPHGFSGMPCLGVFLATGPESDRARLKEARDAIRGDLEGRGRPPGLSVTLMDGTLVCRALGRGAEEVREYLSLAWDRARPALLGRAPEPPRVWRT
jgi:urease accessory protein